MQVDEIVGRDSDSQARLPLVWYIWISASSPVLVSQASKPHSALIFFAPNPLSDPDTFYHVPKCDLRNKLEAKSTKCMFLGYSTTQKGYKCHDPSNNRTYVSRDVKFLEEQGYYKEKDWEGLKDLSKSPSDLAASLRFLLDHLGNNLPRASRTAKTTSDQQDQGQQNQGQQEEQESEPVVIVQEPAQPQEEDSAQDQDQGDIDMGESGSVHQEEEVMATQPA